MNMSIEGARILIVDTCDIRPIQYLSSREVFVESAIVLM